MLAKTYKLDTRECGSVEVYGRVRLRGSPPRNKTATGSGAPRPSVQPLAARMSTTLVVSTRHAIGGNATRVSKEGMVTTICQKCDGGGRTVDTSIHSP